MCCSDQAAMDSGASQGSETHMHAAMVEDHRHGAPVGDLPVEAGDLSLDQVHEGFTLSAHPAATGKHGQGTTDAHTISQGSIRFQTSSVTGKFCISLQVELFLQYNGFMLSQMPREHAIPRCWWTCTTT